MEPYSGQCLCGQVRYSVTADPIHAGLCHCRECQRATGSAFSAFMCFPADAIHLTGQTKATERVSGRGTMTRRNFCPDCGTTVYGGDLTVGTVNIYAGTLDQPERFQPGAMVYTRSRQLWSHVQPGTLYEMERIPGHED
jgi:hypothetical protein